MKFYVGLFAGVLTLVITVASGVAAFCGGIFVGYKLRESEEPKGHNPQRARTTRYNPHAVYEGGGEPSTIPEEPDLP